MADTSSATVRSDRPEVKKPAKSPNFSGFSEQKLLIETIEDLELRGSYEQIFPKLLEQLGSEEEAGKYVEIAENEIDRIRAERDRVRWKKRTVRATVVTVVCAICLGVVLLAEDAQSNLAAVTAGVASGVALVYSLASLPLWLGAKRRLTLCVSVLPKEIQQKLRTDLSADPRDLKVGLK